MINAKTRRYKREEREIQKRRAERLKITLPDVSSLFAKDIPE